MSSKNIKAPYECMELKEYKLSDFVPEFSEFRQFDDLSRFGCENIEDNLIRLEKRGKIHFQNRVAICPSCKSHHAVKNGVYERKLIFLRIGEQICTVQKYKCKKCGKVFYSDLSSIVYPNSNITLPVIDCIENLYQIYGAGLHKIRFDLKQQHNIEISHQSIENILLNSNYEFNYETRSYSGYYLFDSLWVKINGEWNYILALFDVKLNTLVSIKLVDSEDSKTIYQFLNESLRNQEKKSIGTDLKHEYREAIDKLKVKHHFCKFHVKQAINKRFKDYFDKNQLKEEEFEELIDLKKHIFKILDAENLNDAKNLRKRLFERKFPQNTFTIKIVDKFIIPYFQKLTNHLENKNIPSTNNKIENIFQKIFPKHIKRTMKIEQGLLSRFMLKLNYWNIKNEKEKNHTSF
ncbi:MAG: DDE-type integrase/transposase/recombinase [Methanobrevibacter sp.]|uniref:DDE-type integrase/transposase/recombinase n=1 Tax=Methanobrevibacter sp. TaxID=66852 RepID=UPI002E79DF04|nr:DDE-type integrase/transposase/recombinase [Methanobrevibacter sp.]MEE0935688.1 DDE-type integrase/transposase/recombinase [Methanobrevibacter sp.]